MVNMAKIASQTVRTVFYGTKKSSTVQTMQSGPHIPLLSQKAQRAWRKVG